MQSLYDEQDGLPSPRTAEVRFLVVICATYFGTAWNCTNSPLPAHLLSKGKWPGFETEEPRQPPRIIRF